MELSVLTVCGTLVAGLVLYILVSILTTQSNDLARIPGPPGLPLLGHTLQLTSSARHKLISKWATKFGGVFKTSLWGRTCVVVADPAAASKVLGHGTADMPKRLQWYKSWAQVVSPKGMSSLLTGPSDEYWNVVRKCVSHSFTGTELILDFEVAKSKAALLCASLAQLGAGVVVDVQDAAKRLSLDIVGLTMLQYDFNAVDNPDDHLVMQLLQECSLEWQARLRLPLRPHLWWCVDSIGTARQKYRIFHAFMQSMWKDVKERGPASDEDRSLVAQLARLRSPRSGRSMPDDVVVTELGTFLLASYEPLAHLLSWALYLLARSPGVQAKLLAELKREGVQAAWVNMAYSKIGKLQYLDAVLREVMRLYPTGGDGTIREASRELQLGPYRVPKGTVLWVHPYAMHRSTQLWQDPGSFNPDRWMAQPAVAGQYDGFATAAEDAPAWMPAAAGASSSSSRVAEANEGGSNASGSSKAADGDAADVAGSSKPEERDKGKENEPKASKVKARKGAGNKSVGDAANSEAGSKVAGTSSATTTTTAGDASEVCTLPEPQLCPRAAFMPFGVGSRSCVGQALALVGAKTCLAMMVSCFKFELAADSPDLFEDHMLMTLGPKQGVPLVLTPRE